MPATSDWGSQESESGELSLEWNTRQLEAVHRREKKTKGGKWCSTTVPQPKDGTEITNEGGYVTGSQMRAPWKTTLNRSLDAPNEHRG